MELFDKLTELAVNVGGKANGALEMSRLTVQQKNEEKTLGELAQKLGELYLEILRGSDEIPEEVRPVFDEIIETEQRLHEVISAIEAKRAEEAAAMEAKRAEEAAARAAVPNYGGMKCLGCGPENASSAKFCAQCGVKLEVEVPKRFCVHCGMQITADSKFCPHCGGQQD